MRHARVLIELRIVRSPSNVSALKFTRRTDTRTRCLNLDNNCGTADSRIRYRAGNRRACLSHCVERFAVLRSHLCFRDNATDDEDNVP